MSKLNIPSGMMIFLLINLQQNMAKGDLHRHCLISVFRIEQ